MNRIALVLLTLLFLQGCSTYAVNRYSMSMDNVEAAKVALGSSGATVSVGAFSSSRRRAGSSWSTSGTSTPRATSERPPATRRHRR